jgi:riboflavin biosynthesis pyrimidine reductase
MQRLIPDPGPVDAAELIGALHLGDHSPSDRPYTIANFVASADGRASVGGGSTGLGDSGDLAVFRALRGCADAVLAGTGTLRAEQYGPLARNPDVAALRARLDLPAQPPLVTISSRGSIPKIPLLSDPASTLILYTTTTDDLDVDVDAVAATVVVERRDPEALTIAAVLEDLRTTHGVRLLLCEGGPSIFGELVGAGLCDELFLTLAGKLAGGDGGAITSHLDLEQPLALALRWALEQDGSLYLRYGLHG